MASRKSRIVNIEEVNLIGTLPPAKIHWVRAKMLEMNVNEILLVLRSEWNWTNKTPNVIVQDINNKSDKKFEFLQAADYSGWFIKRLL